MLVLLAGAAVMGGPVVGLKYHRTMISSTDWLKAERARSDTEHELMWAARQRGLEPGGNLEARLFDISTPV